jgi:polysaccharide biosynthesis protein PslH
VRSLLVCPLLPHPGARTAGALVMYEHLRALAESGPVALAAFAGPDEGEALERLRREGIEVHAVPRAAGRWLRRLRAASGWARGEQPLRALKFHHPRMQELLDRLLAERRLDLLQVEDNAMGAYRYRTDAPALLVEQEVREVRPRGEAGWGPDARRWPAFQRAVWRRFDLLQVYTRRDAAEAAAIAPDLAGRLRVNPFGIDLPPEADPAREEPGTVVFVGGFLHPPNVDAALWLGREIFPRLRALHPPARLLLVGDRPPAAVRRLQGGGVEVTGRVPAVEPYLERAAVVAAPLRRGGGMRWKVLQALALGKAVVATALAAEGIEPGEDGPPLALAENASGLAERIAALLGSEAERRALGRRARRAVAERHGREAAARRLAAIHQELLAGAERGRAAAGAGR